jgi:hypothetical protein
MKKTTKKRALAGEAHLAASDLRNVTAAVDIASMWTGPCPEEPPPPPTPPGQA